MFFYSRFIGNLLWPPEVQPSPDDAEQAFQVAERMRAQVFVEELDAPQIRVGTFTQVTADGLPGKTFQGRVVRLSPMMGPKQVFSDRPSERHDTKTREVWIDLGASSQGLIFGLRVDVYFDLDQPTASSAP